MKNRTRKSTIFALLAAAGIAACWGLYPKQADAQTRRTPIATQSSGHLTLSAGESARVGLLLPAVQKVREAALVVRDSRGNVMFKARPEASQIDSFFDITYIDDARGTGRMVLTDMNGNELGVAASDDGVLIALLVPAVQANHAHGAKPAANVQIFDATGRTAGFDAFFDISYPMD